MATIQTETVGVNVPDPFFHIPVNTQWNACIGPQGHEENYIDGYIDAALILAHTVIEKGMLESRDTLVLPILYNARHGIELSLKYVIGQLVVANVLHASNVLHHRIDELYETLTKRRLGDYELERQLFLLAPFVRSVSSIDEDGQQLRYAQNVAGEISLPSKPLANVEFIAKSLQSLQKILSEMKSRTKEFRRERRFGDHTPECSRSDLLSIVQDLPARNDWKSESFETAKRRHQERLKLSNRKFSEALGVIQKNREMGSLLGLEFDLHHLTDELILFVMQEWSKMYPPRKEASSEIVGNVREIILDRSRRDTALQVLKTILERLHPEQIADLEAVFYLGRDRAFPEEYDARLQGVRSEHALNANLADDLNHLLTRTNLLACVAYGLQKLGRPAIARRLHEMRPDLPKFR